MIRLVLLLTAALFFFSGCHRLSPDAAQQAATLGEREMAQLIAGNTLTLVSYDLQARVYFAENGELAAIDPAGARDLGRWEIKDERLCLKFRNWYYGELSCYSLTKDAAADRLYFIGGNGITAFRAEVRQGDAAGLRAAIPERRQEPSGRKQTRQPEPQQTEKTKTSGASGSAGSADLGFTETGSLGRLAANCPGCNLSGAELQKAELAGADLRGADLSGADLRYANLRRARLAGADLSNARLNYANLPGADLTDSNLQNADLTGANLLLADLTGADLTGAILDHTHFEHTRGIEQQP